MRAFLSHRSTVALLVTALPLSACSDSEPSARPSASDADQPATTDPMPTAGPSGARSPSTAHCSAAELSIEIPLYEDIDESAAEAARSLLDATLRCDEQVLVTTAHESGTQLTFGGLEPGQMFGLPERDTLHYEVLARLLGRTEPAQITTGEGTIWAWPAAFANPGAEGN